MNASIIDRGRGPEIAGTRITVFDIWDYAGQGWHPDVIATTLRLSSVQVRAAIDYIESHKEEVVAAYQRMRDRETQGNPPEIRERLEAIHAHWERVRAERCRQDMEEPDARNPGRR
jgi:uncharacterized protein (DUF433 family)